MEKISGRTVWRLDFSEFAEMLMEHGLVGDIRIEDVDVNNYSNSIDVTVEDGDY